MLRLYKILAVLGALLSGFVLGAPFVYADQGCSAVATGELPAYSLDALGNTNLTLPVYGAFCLYTDATLQHSFTSATSYGRYLSNPLPVAASMTAGYSGYVAFLVSTDNTLTDTIGYIPFYWNGTAIVPSMAPYAPNMSTVGIATSSVQSFCNSSFATSSNIFTQAASDVGVGFCNAVAFLFVPSSAVLGQYAGLASTSQSKIPFSYFYSAQSIYNGLTASSTENLPSYSITLPAFGSTTPLGSVVPTTIPILSTTTISQYYPDGIRESGLLLMEFVIWLEVVLVFYRRIVPHKVL